MTPVTWQRAKSILAEAIDVSPDQRRAFIVRRAEGDESLIREVESLLRGDSVLYGQDAPASPAPSAPLASTRDEPTDAPRSAVDHDDAALQVWGDYLLLQELGRGGFGVVHRAWDPQLQRDVALKVINVRRLSQQRREALLSEEGQMLARLHHPNVVTVHAVQRRGADVGLVMEYIRGLTLADQVARTGPMKPEQVARIGVTMCQALTAVHRAGLVHRDIKAANVMCEDGGRLVLMDFGAGHALVGHSIEASAVVGTPIYMSPEVLAGRAATPASDVYSLGVLLFYLLTGDYPPRPAAAGQVPPGSLSVGEALRRFRPGVPEALVEAVTAAIAEDRHVRPSPAALRRTLDAVVTTRKNRAPRKTPNDEAPPAPPTPRWRATVGTSIAAAAAALALVVVVGFVTTLEFNHVLGRTGRFAEEPWYVTPIVGIRALLPALIYAGVILLAVNVAAVACKLFGAVAPGLVHALQRVRDPVVRRAHAAGLDDPNTSSQVMCLVGATALGVMLVTFSGLLDAYAGRADTSTWQDLAALDRTRSSHQAFRFLLTVLLVFLGHCLLKAFRTQSGRHLGLDGPTAGLAALFAIVVVLQAAPWRIVRGSTFREATFDGRPCFVIGEDERDRLVHCPRQLGPRNAVVARDDPRLTLGGTSSDVFAAYNR